MRNRGGWFLCAAAVCLMLVGRAEAVPRGTLGTWVESRSFKYGAFARELGFNSQVFHSDGIWLPDNAGVWTTLLEYSSEDMEFLVDGRNIPTGWGRLSLSLGDFAWDSPDDELRREYRQHTLVRGAGFRLHRGVEWHASAGVLTERGVFLGTGRRSAGIPVMRAGAGDSLGGSGRWDVSWERQGSGDREPGMHLGNLYASRPFGEHWTGSAETRFSRSDSGSWGTSLAAGLAHQSPRSVLGIGARRVSAGFTGVGLYRDPHVNEVGVRLHGAMRFQRRGLSGFFLDVSRDLDKAADREPEKRVHARLHASTTLAGPIYAQGRLNYRNRSTIEPDSLLVDQNAFSGRVETGLRGRTVQGYVSYTRGLYRSRLDQESDWHEDRVESQLNVNFGTWFRTQILGQFAERRLPDGRWTSREKRAEIRIMAEPSEARRAWITAGRESQDASVEDFRRDNWVVGLGWHQGLPQNFAFEVEAQAALHADSYDVESLRWSGRLVHHLSFGQGRVRVTDSVEEYGSVSGFVFEDTNNNGVRDPLEPGIPGQMLVLGSGPSATTRDDGSFYFDRADIILDYMRFKSAHLPSRYLPPDGVEFELHLKPGDHERVDIPVQLSASVRGRVTAVDEEGNERPVDGILIRVVGSHRDAFTNDRGEYFIGGLPAGEQTLELVDWSIPELHEPQTSRWNTVVLTAGETATASEYRLLSKKPVLLQWFRIR